MYAWLDKKELNKVCRKSFPVEYFYLLMFTNLDLSRNVPNNKQIVGVHCQPRKRLASVKGAFFLP